MAWNQITLYANKVIAEKISDILHELGAVAVTLREGGAEEIFEPFPGETPLWSDTLVIGLFEDDLDIAQVLAISQQSFLQQCSDHRFPTYKIEVVADQDWERAWLKDFQPMQFGEKLWIVPSAYEPVDKSAVNIFLDPGLAFGTGTHATTALCLKWLARNLDNQNTQGMTVIDYGCGSGVLAIAAAKFGCEQVFAVDIDPQAVIASKMNASQNGVENNISVHLVDDFDVLFGKGEADLLIANILANPLMMLAESFADMLKPDSRIVLSGILQNQADEVLRVYGQWFEMDAPVLQDGWAMLSGKMLSGKY